MIALTPQSANRTASVLPAIAAVSGDGAPIEAPEGENGGFGPFFMALSQIIAAMPAPSADAVIENADLPVDADAAMADRQGGKILPLGLPPTGGVCANALTLAQIAPLTTPPLTMVSLAAAEPVIIGKPGARQGAQIVALIADPVTVSGKAMPDTPGITAQPISAAEPETANASVKTADQLQAAQTGPNKAKIAAHTLLPLAEQAEVSPVASAAPLRVAEAQTPTLQNAGTGKSSLPATDEIAGPPPQSATAFQPDLPVQVPVQTAATAPLQPTIDTAPQTIIQPAAKTGMARFSELIEALAQARETMGTGHVRTTLSHGEFGIVALAMKSDERGLSVTMGNSDPAFTVAVTASAAAQGAQQNAHNNAQQGQQNPAQQNPQHHGAASGGNDQHQPQQQGPAPRQRDALDTAPAGKSDAIQTSRPARRGILA